MKQQIALIAALCLAACASAPTHFYRLDAKAPDVPVVAKGAAIKVTTVAIPRLLDRDQLVRMTGTEQVELGAQDHWVAPLDALIQQTLTQDLALRLPDGSVIPVDAPSAVPALTIAVDIMRFDGDNTGRITLDAFWSATGSDPARPLAAHHEHIELTKGSGTYPDIADGMSQAVGMLADRIAGELP
jgi:uncharacterized lipoprotein YmbA